ncbi:MAG: hypothetical protein RH982_17875 [Parvibaculum sp.]
MFEALTKYLDLLKASAWQVGMLAVASYVFIYLSKVGVVPALNPPWVEILAWALALGCTALAFAPIGSGFQSLAERFWKSYQQKVLATGIRQAFIDDIPFLSEKEMQILAYLLQKKEKRFIADHDGGYAATLLAKRYVQYIGAPGQSFDLDKVPMTVAAHVWSVMEEQPERFPYRPKFSSRDQRIEVHPWRIPWQLR